MRDVRNKVGGMAHIMLPTMSQAATSIQKPNVFKYADTAIPFLIEEILALGGKKHNLTAKIIGGANMFKNNSIPEEETVGYRNQIQTIQTLSDLGIKLIAQDVGGYVGRTITFDLETGIVNVRTGKITYQI